MVDMIATIVEEQVRAEVLARFDLGDRADHYQLVDLDIPCAEGVDRTHVRRCRSRRHDSRCNGRARTAMTASTSPAWRASRGERMPRLRRGVAQNDSSSAR